MLAPPPVGGSDSFVSVSIRPPEALPVAPTPARFSAGTLPRGPPSV